jgi:hypothetical protein
MLTRYGISDDKAWGYHLPIPVDGKPVDKYDDYFYNFHSDDEQPTLICAL